jgi:hypothetical protein
VKMHNKPHEGYLHNLIRRFQEWITVHRGHLLHITCSFKNWMYKLTQFSSCIHVVNLQI